MSVPVKNSRGRARLRLATVLALVALLVTGPTVAWSLWSTETSVTTTATAGVVTPPSGLRCDTRSLLGLLPRVELNWQPAAGPTPEEYRVILSDGTNSARVDTVDGSTTTVDLTVDLLSDGVVGWLLSLITDGGQATVAIEAVHESGWTSAQTNSVPVRLAPTGVRCA